MLADLEFLAHLRQPAAVVHLTIPRHEIGRVMGPAIGEVMAAVAAQGLPPTGPVFSRHFDIQPHSFDFEVGIPIAGDLAPVGRVRRGELPEARVARTVYQGPYEGLEAAWREFDARIVRAGHRPGRGVWECYLAGPESGDDPARWRTELNHVLAG